MSFKPKRKKEVRLIEAFLKGDYKGHEILAKGLITILLLRKVK